MNDWKPKGIKPYYEDDAVFLIHGDCREIVPMLGKFDLLLTDPPYGLSERLQGGTWRKSFEGKYRNWDAAAPCLGFLDGISKAQMIWGGNYFPLPPSRGWLVWNKPERGLTMADAELCWTNRDENIRVFDSSRNPDGKREHPTQKPFELMTWCITLDDGGGHEMYRTILDPFCGSGTTGRAAKDLGRKCVMIEREEKYCEIAARRMEQEVFNL